MLESVKTTKVISVRLTEMTVPAVGRNVPVYVSLVRAASLSTPAL